MSNRKVILVEFNEINWQVIDALIAERGEGFLPNIARLKREGVVGAPVALEKPPNLDPWITWVTVHTGVTQDEHGAKILEQDTASVTAKRSWEYAEEAGRSIGIFGSIGAYPPRQVDGFIVPGPFAPSDETYPEALRPIQSLNRMHTRAHGAGSQAMSIAEMASTALRLLQQGLKVSTCARIIAQLAREQLNRSSHWRRVVLQPLLNFDFFSHLYRAHQPDFATWHSNHAAHYMHHYWRAWSDSGFLTPGPSDEKQRFGEAVPLGYKICDELLGRFLDLAADRAVLVVCSSMGQQPFVNAAYRDGKVIVRFRDVANFLQRMGGEGITEIVPTMVPQINVRVPDAQQRTDLATRLRGVVRMREGNQDRALSVEETGEVLTLTPVGLSESSKGVFYQLHPGSADAPLPLNELFVADAPTVKQGMHHERGLLIAYGPGIPRGVSLPECTNLDIAPTVLGILGIQVPPAMSGRPLF